MKDYAACALLACLALSLLFIPWVSHQRPAPAPLSPPASLFASDRSSAVKEEFLHAWTNYKRYAWGHDDLKPLTKVSLTQSYTDWMKLKATAIDALSTLWVMNLREEFQEVEEDLVEGLNFARADLAVSHFELNIRILGGLLSAYELSGRTLIQVMTSSSRNPPNWAKSCTRPSQQTANSRPPKSNSAQKGASGGPTPAS